MHAVAAHWSEPQDEGTSPITGYQVVVYENGLATRTISVAPGRRALVVDGLDNGVDTMVKVIAENASGTGQRSERSNDVVTGRMDLRPFATADALVEQQFLDFVGRPATDAERSSVVRTLGRGTPTPAEWVASMRLRPEWGGRRAPIVRLYQASFGRLPDAAGLTYWTGRLASGSSLERVALQFVASSEFQTRHGSLSNAEFVTWAYEDILGRQPDASGLAYWTRKLDGGQSRGAFVRAFSESTEYVRRTGPQVDVVLVTTGLLRRMPSTDELADGVQQLQDEGSVVALVADILLDNEYGARVS